MSRTRQAAVVIWCGLVAAGWQGCITKSSPGETSAAPSAPSAPSAPAPGPAVTQVGAALQTLATKAIYFGHQSVGGNIIEGIQALLAGVPGTVPRVQDTSAPSAMQRGVFAHAGNGSNGDPLGKTAAFRATILGGVGARVDVAFFKFCYVDFDGSTNVTALFANYSSTVAALRSAFPGVRFVHFTVPLMTGADRDNAVRERFSDLIRQTYGVSDPVFDVARVESTRPDGSTELVNGVRALVGAYSDDGGHLNATGRAVVATALVLYLASL